MSARLRQRMLWVAALAAVLIAAAAGYLLRRLRRRPPSVVSPAPVAFDVQGLSQEEARARLREGQSNSIHFTPPRTRARMIRESAFTVFNTGLVAIIFVQILLGKLLDALVSFGVLIFTIGVNVFQEEFARIRLRKVQEAAMPRAAVIRDGQVRSIDPDEIVVGDVVEFGPGDLIPVDGRLLQGRDVVMEETLIFGRERRLVKEAGDPIYAGSLCLNGRGVLEATAIDNQRLIQRRLQQLPPRRERMTPIEALIDRVLKWLLAFVLAIAAFLLTRFFTLSAPLPQDMVDLFIDAIGVIFSIAPAGLFFMISLTYAASTVDLARLRVLVNRARAIETLAQIDILCLVKSGFITGQWIEMSPVKGGDSANAPDEPELRRMLGAFARSISHKNQLIRLMQVTYEGLQLPPLEEMPFFAHYGWMGLRLESEELRGVFVLCEPALLASALAAEEIDEKADEGGVLSQTAGRLGRLFRRTPAAEASPPAGPPVVATVPPAAPEPEESKGLFGRIRRGAARVVKRAGREAEGTAAPAVSGEEKAALIFAWLPEPQSLYDEAGRPQLPQGLQPLCRLSYQERPNPEAVQALEAFAANGVASKLFDDGPVEGIREALRAAGADEELVGQFRGVSARELEGLDDDALAEAIVRAHLVGDASSGFVVRVVRALRRTGHLVGMLGGGARELDAMLAADLGVTVVSGSSGALSVADIVLLDTSPRVVTAMIDKGQRIVNGLLDVLKLYLTQAFYLLMLVGALLLLKQSFPYRGAQGGIIAFLGISVPALALTLTAQPGRLHIRNVSASLFSFVVPASIGIAAVGYVLFSHMLRVYGERAYAQNVLVHALMAMSLLMVVLMRPPVQVIPGSLIPVKPVVRWRYFLPLLASLVSCILFVMMTFIPLVRGWLGIPWTG